MAIILSCDPGSITTGWACLETTPLSYYDSGVISLGEGEFWDKIGILKSELSLILEKYQPSLFVLEKAFVSLNKQTALKLAQVRGCLMGLVHSHGCQFAEYAPREVKLQITGYGAATKEQIAMMCRRILPSMQVHSQRFDETDAIAIGLCHALRMKTPMMMMRGTI